MLQATSRLLKKAGYQVIKAGTGIQGLQLAREQKPDLILLDVVLPDVDGVEVCQRIKEDPALDDCFVVLLSGFKTSSDAQASGLEAGADGYITRPISNRELLARVEAMLRIKRAEERLARYATQLKRSNQELEQFAYVISHDLQEPTRMIKGYLDLLERRYGDSWDEEASRYVSHALEGAQRMQKMIGALLDLSRIETRGQALELTDAGAVLERTLEALSWVTKEAEAQVTHDPLPEILADAAQLSQVFQNLVSNAIKFRRPDEPPRIHISAQRTEGAWRFSVADNGIGIAPEQKEHIFQIFCRLHPEQDYPGLGIGLALCRSIVERHGGRMWVESTPGQGSTFYFTVPEGKESRLVQASEQKKRT
jgi:light-regulated signal transduction histidine kinase (bacteriophytochrome)